MHNETEQHTKWLVAVGLLVLTLAVSVVGGSADPEPILADPVRIVFPDVETEQQGLIFWSSRD